MKIQDGVYDAHLVGSEVRLSNNGKPMICFLWKLDESGETIKALATKLGIKTALFTQSDFHTTVKTRLIANNNHLLRIDTENRLSSDNRLLALVKRKCSSLIKTSDIILLSDYGKGLLSGDLCPFVISCCIRCGKRVIVDPKGSDYSKYKNAFLIKPNLKELSFVTGKSFNPASPNFFKDIAREAKNLARRLKLNGILVTLSEHGMLYAPASASGKSVHLQTTAKEVFDVSGAGDTALAALGAALGAGHDITYAMRMSNIASGIVVSKLGTATAGLDEIHAALRQSNTAWKNKGVQ